MDWYPGTITMWFRGGWFIGTIMIFYVLTPGLAKIYGRFSSWLRKYIPVIFWGAGSIVQLLLYKLGGRTDLFGNNSFFYFNFINQLPCFLIGISLNYENEKTEKSGIDCLVSMAAFFMICRVTTVFDIWYIYIFVPIVVGIVIRNIMEYAEKSYDKFSCFNNGKNIVKVIEKWGKYSYECFAVHILFVYYFQGLMWKIVCMAGYKGDYVFFWMIMIPIILVLTYLCGFKIHNYAERFAMILYGILSKI